ncbi:MAG: choice-of-anchor J domain-containing protein [Bacteroidales bacterium]|nr:choice-of-anchor J domain-containing protein [Bacteroidales bacterium]
MKKHLLTLFLFSSCLLLFAGNGFKAKFNQPAQNKYEISFELADWSLKEVTASGQIFQKIVFDGSAVTEKKGWAELPFISASVQLPNDKDVDMEIIEGQYVDIQLSYPMLPSRGTIYRNQDPSKIAYKIAPASKTNEFYPADLSVMESPFIIRDVRGTTVRVFPFRYNAATNTLRVYSNVKVILTENNKPATNPLLRENITPTKDALGIYQSMFINFEPSRLSANLTSMDEFGDILVITTSDYMATMDPYIQWKREKGYNVTTETVTKGTNISTAVQTAYTNNNKLMYVQIAGDWADIKTPTYSSAPTDPFLGCVSGSDNYPDIAIGRFSCSGTADLKIQIDKAIKYEKNPDMTAGWRETFIGIASEQGSGYGDDEEADYDHIKNIFNNKLQPNLGYQTHQQNYNQGTEPSSTTLAGYINSGASTIAYCGHGDTQEWVTTGYDNTQVNAATNGDKLPFIVSVACVNGEFHNTSKVCFAEAWLRKANGGAVVYWGSTINQPWTPPQRGQDYFYDILIGGYNYDNYADQYGYNTTEQRTHWGCIAVNAFNLMLKESSTSSDLETVKTWTTFGDAAVQLRTKQPDAIVLSNEMVVPGSAFAGKATVNGSPVENAQICISQNGTYFSTLTDASGNYSINHTFTSDSVLLVVTAFNTTTIYKNVFCTAPCDGATNLVATPDPSMEVNLTWDAPANNEWLYYNVYCNGNLIATTTTTSYLHTDLLNATYNYSVAVVYNDGECPVKASGSALVSDGSNHDCNGATDLKAQQNGHNLVLSWSAPASAPKIFDDVEGHTAFTINSAGTVGWTYIDGDNSQTYGFSNYSFTNAGSKMAYMVLDPTQITADDNTSLSQNENVVAHSGDKFFASIVAKTPPNDDYIISPALSYANSFTFEFYARGGHKSQYVESFEVAYSTTGNSAANFTNVVATVSSVPFSWTKYSYQIPAEAKYVTIHCTSNDAYYLCIDDILIEENSSANISYYQVYCNNVPVGTTTGTSYTINNLPAGNYEYCIETFYTDGCSSLPECANATMEDITYTITATATTGGTITPNGQVTVAEGANQTFTIAPFQNHILQDVKVDNVSVGAVTSYTFTNVTANHTIHAEFAYYNAISENNSANFAIYPNPVDNELSVKSNGSGYLEILNFVGQVVYKQEVTEKEFKINTDNFSSGVYFIRLRDNDSAVTRKFIKR